MKTFFIKAVIMLFFLGFSVKAAENNSIGYWKLAESKGELVKDSSGNDNNGIFVGNRVKGAFGSAIFLEGNNVRFSKTPSLYLEDSDFTIDFWVLPQRLEFNEESKTLRLLSGMGKDSFFVIDLENGGQPQLEMGIKKNGKLNYCNVTAKNKIKSGKWSKLTFVCNRKDLKMQVYINGIQDMEVAMSKLFRNKLNNYVFSIGSSWQGIKGLLREVKISSYSVSGSEIKKQYIREVSDKFSKIFTFSKIPTITPRLELYAEFVNNTRCPVFKYNDNVELWVKVKLPYYSDDVLIWSVLDWKNNVVDSGSIAKKSTETWTTILKLGHYGAGYFQVYLKLKNANITLPKLGTHPAGFVSYSVLPNIKKIPLVQVDDSRFGAQGYSNTAGKKSKYQIYDLGGMKWTYRYRRLFELEEQGRGTFKPVLEPEKVKTLAPLEVKLGMCLFVDAHSIPRWLTKIPKGVSTKRWTRSASHFWSSYPPKDYEEYGKLIGKVAKEQAVLKKLCFPEQAKNYYEIHWEPDWHWKGSDEDFIKMYKYAKKAIKENDPDGLLLGANYGVISTGNTLLKRLFAKGLGKYLDGIVTHTYYLPMLGRSPEQAGIIEEMQKLTAMTRKYLPRNAPIINSEWGVSINDSFGKSALTEPEILNKEAAWFIRGHAIALGEGAQTTFFFYTVDHNHMGVFFNLTAPYRRFSASHIAPKPVFAALTAMTYLLEGTKNVCRIDYLGENTWGYVFDRAGVMLAMLWSKDGKTRTVSLPCGVEIITLYDQMGNAKKIKTIKGVYQAQIGANPVYLGGLSRKAIPDKNNLAPSMVTLGKKPVRLNTDKKYKLFLSKGGSAIFCGDTDNMILPRTLQPGNALLTFLTSEDKLFASRLLKIEAPVTMSAKKDAALSGTFEVKYPLVVSLKNLLNLPVKGVLKILTANNIQFEKKELELKQGVTELGFNLDKMPMSAASISTVKLSFTDSYGVRIINAIEMGKTFTIPKTDNPFKIDGNVSDITLESFQTVNRKSAVKINFADWKGTGDLSYRFSVKYDEKALYFAFKVRDQMFLQQLHALDSWAQDSVQIGIGLGKKGKGWKLFHKFCFADNSKTGKLLAYRHNGIPGLQPGNLKNSRVKFAFKRVGDESFYEVAIPWNELDRKLSGSPLEGVIGLGILVNDVDTGKLGVTKRKAMEAFGGMAVGNVEKLGKAALK